MKGMAKNKKEAKKGGQEAKGKEKYSFVLSADFSFQLFTFS
jgi:hypothetical protein